MIKTAVRWLAAATLAAAVAGCDETPATAYRAIGAAAERGDWGAVYDRIDTRSRARLDTSLVIAGLDAAADMGEVDQAKFDEIRKTGGRVLFLRKARRGPGLRPGLPAVGGPLCPGRRRRGRVEGRPDGRREGVDAGRADGPWRTGSGSSRGRAPAEAMTVGSRGPRRGTTGCRAQATREVLTREEPVATIGRRLASFPNWHARC